TLLRRKSQLQRKLKHAKMVQH
ncbi:putative clp amino terminal domain protein, partial [Vibrio parahaemolyticus 10296]